MASKSFIGMGVLVGASSLFAIACAAAPDGASETGELTGAAREEVTTPPTCPDVACPPGEIGHVDANGCLCRPICDPIPCHGGTRWDPLHCQCVPGKCSPTPPPFCRPPLGVWDAATCSCKHPPCEGVVCPPAAASARDATLVACCPPVLE